MVAALARRPCCRHAGLDHPGDRARAARCWPIRGCAPGSTGARPGPATPKAASPTTSPRSSPRSPPTTRCATTCACSRSCTTPSRPRSAPHGRWSPDNDHATLARRFAEHYTSDERLLATLELHDEPYWIWRHADAPEQALQTLLDGCPTSSCSPASSSSTPPTRARTSPSCGGFGASSRSPDGSPTHPATGSRRGGEGRRLRQGIRHRAAPAAGHRATRRASSSREQQARMRRRGRGPDQRRRTARVAALALAADRGAS